MPGFSSDVGVINTFGHFNSALFTTPGTFTWLVPSGVNTIFVDAVSGGQGGAGGQASATGGGGGGGAGGAWIRGYAANVTPGSTLTLVVGSGGLGAAAGSNGGTANMTTSISGTNTPLPSLSYSGTSAQTGAAGAGGNGGLFRTGVGLVVSTGGTNAPTNGGAGLSSATTVFQDQVGGQGGVGGAGGGSSGSTGANGGNGGPMSAWFLVTGGVLNGATAGGGAGGSTPFGVGGIGGTNTGNGSAPASGFGGGGGGGSSNGAGGNGAGGFILIRY